MRRIENTMTNARTFVIQGTASFPHLVTPKAPKSGLGDPKYALVVAWDKGQEATTKKVRDAFEAAFNEGKAAGKIPEKATFERAKSTFTDGDESDSEHFKGQMSVSTRSKGRPTIVGPDNEAIDPSEIYPGAIIKVVGNAYAYDVDGSKGITASIDLIQFVRDGERLDGRPSTESLLALLDD